VFSTLGAYLEVTDLLSCKVEWPSGYIVYENRKDWIFGSNSVSAIILPSSDSAKSVESKSARTL
jgi:hypothetical protein